MSPLEHYKKIKQFINLLGGVDDEYGAVRFINTKVDRIGSVPDEYIDNNLKIVIYPFQPADNERWGTDSKADPFTLKELDLVECSAAMGRVTLKVYDRSIHWWATVVVNLDGDTVTWLDEVQEDNALYTFGKGISPLGIVRYTEGLLKTALTEYKNAIETAIK